MNIKSDRRKGLCIDLAGESKTIWVVGAGRSGTTWISDLINFKNEYRFLFEPLHPLFVDEIKPYNLFPYLRPGEENKRLCMFYKSVFEGTIRNTRVCNIGEKYNSRILYRRRIVKDIFANLCMAWVHKHFPSVKILFVLRHPCAVALSKKKLNHWYWLDEPKQFLKREKLLADHLGPYKEIFSECKSYFEKQIAVWCVVNLVPLRQLAPEDICIIFYEEILCNPQNELIKIFDFIGRKNPVLDAKLAVEATINTPSITSHKETIADTDERRLLRWKAVLRTEEIQKAIDILETFGLADIYNDDLMPNVSAAIEFMRSNKTS